MLRQATKSLLSELTSRSKAESAHEVVELKEQPPRRIVQEVREMPREVQKEKPITKPEQRSPNDHGVTIIKDPLIDLPAVGYDVGEEQPPYASGHQDMSSFKKLFVHNLDFNITKEGILRTFGVYGKIKNINIPFDGRNRPRGLAFVIFERHYDADKALKAGIRGIQIGMRRLRVEVYKPLEKLQQEKKEK
jgi:hypothetical protein